MNALANESGLAQEETTAVNDIVVFKSYGLDGPDWVNAMKSFASAAIYTQSVKRFLSTLNSEINSNDNALLEALVKYFYDDHGSGIGRAPTIYRSWFSHFQKFWKITRKATQKI